MRQILTHKSRTAIEILDVIRLSGSFTAPLGLPHYRYDNTRRNCHLLTECGIIKKLKVNDIHFHFSKGDNYDRWLASELEPKEFCKIVKKEHKALNPRKPKIKICRGCGCRFETLNYHQKSCKRGCKPNTDTTRKAGE